MGYEQYHRQQNRAADNLNRNEVPRQEGSYDQAWLIITFFPVRIDSYIA